MKKNIICIPESSEPRLVKSSFFLFSDGFVPLTVCSG